MRIKKAIRKAFACSMAIVAACVALSCSHPSAESTLRQAEDCVALGDTIAARSACEALTQNHSSDMLPSQMCRQALVYARVGEITDNSDDMAAASQCLERAMEANLDSVYAYVASLGVQDRARMLILLDLGQSMANPQPVIDEGDEEE